MKRVTFSSATTLIITFLLLSFTGFAQLPSLEYIWGKGITGANIGSAYHVAMDKAPGVERLVQVGRFTDTLVIDHTNWHSEGGMYIAYSDTNGNVLWAIKEGLNYPTTIYGYSCPNPLDVEMLPNGDVVVLGTLCADSLNTISGTPITTHGYFIAYYNSAGAFQWLKTYNVKNSTYRTGNIETSGNTGANNQIYVAFTYADTLALDTDTISGQSTLANTALFALDLAGNEVWVQNLPGQMVTPKDVLSIYNHTLHLLVDYQNLTIPLGSFPFSNSAIVTFDVRNGNFHGIQHIGNFIGGGNQFFEATALDLIGSMSRLAVAGRFSGTVAIGPDTLISANGGNEIDVWVAEIDTPYSSVQLPFHWARSITSPGQDYATDVIGYAGYDLVVAGTLGIGGAVVAGDTLLGGGFMASFDENGNAQWTLQQPMGFTASINSIKPGWNRSIYVGGGIMFEALFGTDNIVNPAIGVNTVAQVSYLAKALYLPGCNLQAVIAGNDTLVVCQTNQQLVSTVFGGSGNYSVSWWPPQYLNNPNSTSPSVVEHVHLQQFVLQGTDNVTGCVAHDTVVVGVYKPQFDTIYLCPGDTAFLDMGPGATIYDWVNLPFAGPTAQVATVDTPGVFWGVATYNTPPVNCGSLTSMFTVLDSCTAQPDSVWPGDANADGIADLYDVLNIGIGYNISGPVRANASTVWVGQAAADWNLAFLSGTNLKHADCDGNGHIDSLDVDVVALNYGLTHAKGGGGPVRRAGSPPLRVNFTVDTVQAPAMVTADIALGSDSFPVTDGYGVAFSLLFDNTLVDSSSIQTNFTGSWLGNGGSPQSLTKNLYTQGRLDIAHTRTTHASVSGSGHIATVSFYIQDNIIGKDFAAYNFGLDVSSSLLISDDETAIPLDEVGGNVLVLDEYTGIAEANLPQVSIYPNPSTGLFHITVSTDATVSVYDLWGQKIFQAEIAGNTSAVLLDLSSHADGVYLVRIQNANGAAVKRLAKQ